MQRIQQALSAFNFPVCFGVYKGEPLPSAYIVYTTMRVEEDHADDTLIRYKIYVYLNLYTRFDPETETLAQVRAAMRAAGFALSSETMTWNGETDHVITAFTFAGWEDAENAADV